MELKKVYILVIALFFGLLLVWQIQSFRGVANSLIRDKESNIFQEIKILKDKNESLSKELEELEHNLLQLDDQDLALDSIDEEITKYKKLSGLFEIFGPGLTVTIDEDVSAEWMIDLTNEFFSAGAEAISINDIRIVNRTTGFDSLPKGQILLNGSILSPPFSFRIIGESSKILEFLELPGGIFDRLESTYPNISIKVDKLDVIVMP